MRILPAFVLLFALSGTPVLAEEGLADAPPPPPMSTEEVYSEVEQGLEPQVTITRHRMATVEEYRMSGRLYMIKITPSKGLPYYLVDSDGDGSLETRRNSLNDPEVVKWRLFSW
ncbi:MAG: DUF2782 domain-containing protein [Gammaproteobacteria bacterium]|nr:DUF2782 domain-containing protein [Gammaproteobacteria bacterium]